jgi:hypothetical protein
VKIKIEGAVYFRRQVDYAEQPRMVFLGGTMFEGQTFKALAPYTIEVDVPDFDPRAAEVEALQARRKEIHDKFASAVMEIDQRINSLLAIEMAP